MKTNYTVVSRCLRCGDETTRQGVRVDATKTAEDVLAHERVSNSRTTHRCPDYSGTGTSAVGVVQVVGLEWES